MLENNKNIKGAVAAALSLATPVSDKEKELVQVLERGVNQNDMDFVKQVLTFWLPQADFSTKFAVQMDWIYAQFNRRENTVFDGSRDL